MSSQPNQTVVVQLADGTSELAIAGLIFSILGWFTCGLLCIPGAFLCGLALLQSGPKGMAIAGLIVGFPGTIFFGFVGLGIIMSFLGAGAAATGAAGAAGTTGIQSVAVDTDSSDADSDPQMDSGTPETLEPTVSNDDPDVESRYATLMAKYDSAIREIELEDARKENLRIELAELEEELRELENNKPPPLNYSPRRWESADGKFSITGTLVRTDSLAGTATITREDDGRTVTVKTFQLSDADRNHLRECSHEIFIRSSYDIDHLVLSKKINGLKGQVDAFVSQEKPEPPSRDAVLAQVRQEREEAAAIEAERERDEQAAELKQKELEIIQAEQSKLTLEKFNSIRMGMSQSEVFSILGGPGELSSQNSMMGISTELRIWKQEGLFRIGNCNVMFQNGKVVSKAQFGL